MSSGLIICPHFSFLEGNVFGSEIPLLNASGRAKGPRPMGGLLKGQRGEKVTLTYTFNIQTRSFLKERG